MFGGPRPSDVTIEVKGYDLEPEPMPERLPRPAPQPRALTAADHERIRLAEQKRARKAAKARALAARQLPSAQPIPGCAGSEATRANKDNAEASQ
jgi:hypothetical protein